MLLVIIYAHWSGKSYKIIECDEQIVYYNINHLVNRPMELGQG